MTTLDKSKLAKDPMNDRPMMKCGCAAQGLRHMPDGSKIPSCITHSCIEQIEPPKLDGRRARCAHYGKSAGRNNECNYGAQRSNTCQCEQPSSLDLPFFEYLGEGSSTAQTQCKCGYTWLAHQPRWVAQIEVDQKWYKNPRAKEIIRKEFHAPEEHKSEGAENEAEFWRSRIGNASDSVPVFGVAVVSIDRVSNPLKCQLFTANGAQEFDKFYCGCHGWD